MDESVSSAFRAALLRAFAPYSGNRARSEGLDGKPEHEQQREGARTSPPLPPRLGESPRSGLSHKAGACAASGAMLALAPPRAGCGRFPGRIRAARPGLIRATGRIRGDGGDGSSAQARDSDPIRISRDLEVGTRGHRVLGPGRLTRQDGSAGWDSESRTAGIRIRTRQVRFNW